MVPSSKFQGAPVWEDPPWSEQGNCSGRSASDCAAARKPPETGLPRDQFHVPRSTNLQPSTFNLQPSTFNLVLVPSRLR